MKRAVPIVLACLLPVLGMAQFTTPQPTDEEQPSGMAVDSSGGAVVDPTLNVKKLVEAAIKRTDDIGEMRMLLNDEKFKRVDIEIELHDQLSKLLSKHNTDIIAMQTEFIKIIQEKEANRLDAIRAVDQNAVKNEADRAQQAVATLAAAQAATAETLRASVNTSAANLATALDRTTTAIVERIASLEKAQYVGAGRATITDPNAERIAASVDKLLTAQSADTGKNEGSTMVWVAIMGVVAVASGIFGAIGVIFGLIRNKKDE